MLRSLLLSLAALDLATVRADPPAPITIEYAFVGGFDIGGSSRSAVFSPDGKILVTSSTGGGETRLWDPTTGKELATLPDGGSIDGLAFTPDGKTLAGGPNWHNDGVRLWDVPTRKLTAHLKGKALASWVAITPDGATVATANPIDGDVVLWDVKAGKIAMTLKAKSEGVWGLAFSSDGKSLAVGHAEGTVRVWDVKTRRETVSLVGHTALVELLAFGPGDKTLVTVGHDKTVRRWDLATAKATTIPLKGATKPVGFTFGLRHETVAGAEAGGVVVVWDTKTGAVVHRIDAKGDVRVLVFSPDGKWIAADPRNGDKFSAPPLKVWAVGKPPAKP